MVEKEQHDIMIQILQISMRLSSRIYTLFLGDYSREAAIMDIRKL